MKKCAKFYPKAVKAAGFLPHFRLNTAVTVPGGIPSSVKVPSAPTVALIAVSVLFTIRVQKIAGTEVGVKLNKITGEIGVVTQAGTYIYNGIISSFYGLDKTVQKLEMVSQEDQALAGTLMPRWRRPHQVVTKIDSRATVEGKRRKGEILAKQLAHGVDCPRVAGTRIGRDPALENGEKFLPTALRSGQGVG